jgi:histidinol dehydrogenase
MVDIDSIGPIKDHRSREGGAIIYPVYSRRSGGLSAGVNLFPDRKLCSFDCPYCEVFPFKTDIVFKLETMEGALRSAVLDARTQHIPVRDICFSGNGEPTMLPDFMEALKAAAALRNELVPQAKLVLITNGSGLLGGGTSPQDSSLFEFLRFAACSSEMRLHIWLKLDAGTEGWYKTMDCSDISFARLISRIRDFAAAAPFIIQTMICKVNGVLPPAEESAAWVSLVTELAAASVVVTGGTDGGIHAPGDAAGPVSGPRAVQIYGKARPAPEDPLAEAAAAALLEERAKLLRAALGKAGSAVPVYVYE